VTRVDFYVLPAGTADPVLTACKLCEKAVGQGLAVYLHAAPDVAEALDGALWSYRQGSFLAHEPWRGQPVTAPVPPVLIGELEPPASHYQVLINLAEEIPAWFSRFERVLEIVCGDEAARSRSRSRFKSYRDRGFPLQTHELAA
jgi:DNA polymerase-3 subunit chi